MSGSVIRVLVLLSGGAVLAACQAETATEPLGLRIEERVELGPPAAAIRNAAATHSACPSVPTTPGTGWSARTLIRPAGRVVLPERLQAVTAPSGEVVFYAPDLTAGAFVEEASGLASLEPAPDSPLSRVAMTTCQLQLARNVALVYLISQPHPALPGDSVHLAFAQLAGPGEAAIRAGGFATTRALRDSLLGALLAFGSDSRSPEGQGKDAATVQGLYGSAPDRWRTVR